MSTKKKQQQFEGQHEGEEVLLVFHRHPIVMRKGLIIISITILIGALVGFFQSSDVLTTGDFLQKFFTPIGVGFLVGLIFMFYSWMSWYYSVFIVTNQRVRQIVQKGFFSRSVYDIQLTKIQNISYQVDGLFETMLNFGTIVLQTLVGDLVIRKVGKPAKRQSEIITAIKESGVDLSEENDPEVQ